MPRRRKARRKRRSKNVIKLTKAPIINSARVRMKYATRITLAPSATVAAKHLFSCNSINDPDETGTGHQPLGHDQWNAFYNHYSVLSSICKVTAISNSGTSAGASCTPMTLGIVDDTSNVTTLDTICEQGNSKVMVVPAIQSPPIVMSKKFSQRAFFAEQDPEDSKAGFNNDPGDEAYFMVTASPFDSTGATTPAPVLCLVEIWYDCLLTEPRELAQS